MVFALLQGRMAVLSAAFGGGGAVVMSGLLALRITYLNRRLEQNKAVTVATIMLGFAPRLLLVLMIFWAGLSVFGLAPLPMIITFALVHLGYLFNFLKFKTESRS